MPRSALAALLVLALGPAALAQPVTWEVLPSPYSPGNPNPVAAVDFLRGEGAQADDPSADSLVIFHAYGVFLYNPSGAVGAAGDNGEYGVWHRLCSGGFCYGDDGIVTAAGSILIGSPSGPSQLSRGTNRGRTWAFNYQEYGAYPFFELAQLGPTGAPVIFIGIGNGGETARSLTDGAPGSWVEAGSGLGYPEAFGEVPPSPALPDGRVLMGVVNGALYSDDGGLTYTPSNAFGSFIGWSFTFRPDPGHPYGGVAYAGLQNRSLGDGRGAEVHRSDDGGATWTLAHRFTAAEIELPVPTGTEVSTVVVLATEDGALWAGVSQNAGATNPPRGGIVRSFDGGTTWARADAGFRDVSNRGYAVNQFRLSRTGVLYAATERGVWRTTTAVVAGEAGPNEAPGEFGVSVRPNPAGGRVEVAVSLAEGGPVRAVVLDALGREVAVVLSGEAPAGERSVGVDVSSWPAGVYVVRATAGAEVATARLVVAR